MVGASAMAPERVSLNGSFKRAEDEEAARERIMKRFETIGMQILNRTGSSDAYHHDPIANVLNDREKRALAAQLLGQAYVTAHNFIAANKEAIERIAEVAVEKREIYGDDLLELLDRAGLVAPEIDFRDEAAWPKL
jgi:cell division protease FtsH